MKFVSLLWPVIYEKFFCFVFLTLEKSSLSFCKEIFFTRQFKVWPLHVLAKKQTSVFLHPHVSSPHVCLLCIYVTYVQVSDCVCQAVGAFKLIFQRPTLWVPCVRSFSPLLAPPAPTPHHGVWQPAAPAAPRTHLHCNKTIESWAFI